MYVLAFVIVFAFAFVFVIVSLFWTGQSCVLITQIKCLKSHKSLESLCSVVKTLIDSGAGPRDQGTMSPIELFWTANNVTY